MPFRVTSIVTTALTAVTLLVAAGTRPSAQESAAIRGRVEIGVPITTRRPSASYATRAVVAPALASASELRNVVVYVKDAPSRPMTPVRMEIRQRDEHFFPRVVAVPVGSIVDFPNDDPIYHNVFSLSRAKTFNLGRYRQGVSERVRFDKPGVVKVFCDIHSHMAATVIVFNHPWFATPAADGRFTLPDVPPGDHQVTAWHERLGDTTLSIRLEAGQAASADFTLPVPQQ
jgi:plastocyanin